MTAKTYSLDEIHRLLDPSQTDYSEYSRHSVRVIEHLMRQVAAQDAANARLRDALAALVDAEAHGIPGGYINVYPDETDRYCTYCFTSWRMGEPEHHDDDCPIAAARRALDAP